MRPINRLAAWQPAQAHAVRALASGEATPEQQRAALDWIVKGCAEAFGINDAPDAHAMAFCAGRQSVGLEIAAIIDLPAETITKARGKNG